MAVALNLGVLFPKGSGVGSQAWRPHDDQRCSGKSEPRPEDLRAHRHPLRQRDGSGNHRRKVSDAFCVNSAPSEVNPTLDGSTYPRWKLGCFSVLRFVIITIEMLLGRSGTSVATYKLMEPHRKSSSNLLATCQGTYVRSTFEQAHIQGQSYNACETLCNDLSNFKCHFGKLFGSLRESKPRHVVGTWCSFGFVKTRVELTSFDIWKQLSSIKFLIIWWCDLQ